MFHADLPLARRLESAETAQFRRFAEALIRHRSESGIASVSIGSGWAVFAGPGSPMSEVKGLGMDGPVTDDDLDCLDNFYRGRGVTVRVSVCPLAHASLWEGLGRRSFRTVEFENVLARPLTDREEETPQVNSEIRVHPADPEEADVYLHAVFPNFFSERGLCHEVRDLNDVLFLAEGYVPFLATIQGQVAGGATLVIHEGIALLAGAGTLPPFRNRGVHRALQTARREHAHRLGCDLLIQMAQPGSSSQRNAERQGMRVLYTKVILARDPT